MAYTLTIGLALGSSQTGLTLSAQLKDTAGANVGGAIATGFVELGAGNYSWTYAAFSETFRGSVVFTAAAVVKAAIAINPGDAGTDSPGVTTLLGRIAGSLTTLTSNVEAAIPRSTLSDLVTEKTTLRYSGTLTDETGTAIPAANLTTLTLTLYVLDAARTIVNSVSATNILNTGRGAVDSSGNLTITFTPADMALVDATQTYEDRIALIEWTYGAKAGKHEVKFTVANLEKVT